MRIAAIIAEYNPFHNGHAYHIARTREAGFDRIIIIMDGHLTQRGQFAALSKWDRARAALSCGADMVIELPALHACRSADVFARSGVLLAAAAGADALSFGSECDDISLIRAMARAEEDDTFRTALREGLERGEAQPRARAAALKALLGRDDVPTGPNAILATEYLRALDAIGAGAPEPLIIKRRGEYHSLETGPMASATAIREAALAGDMVSAAEGLPDAAGSQLEGLAGSKGIDDMYLHALRCAGPEGLRQLPDVTEGLENRVYSAAIEAASLEDVLVGAKCKRYTRARLMRLCTHALTGLTSALAESAPAPTYIRVLGMGTSAGELMREVSCRAKLPMFNLSEMRGDPVFAFENRATDLWALTRTLPSERRAGQEYTRKFLRI